MLDISLWRPKALRLAIYLTLFGFSFYFLFPLLVMINTSLKTLVEIRQGSLWTLPKEITFEAFRAAWGSACIGINCHGLKPYFFNSLKMAVPAVVFSTFLGSINGYVLAQWRFKGANLLFTLLLFGCFIPFQSIIIPLAQILHFLDMQNSTQGLALVHSIYGIAFTTLYFRNYYADFPPDLVKAAKIDGAGFFQIYGEIFMPLSLPIFMVSGIWQFTNIWNDFLFGVVLTSGENQPLMVALNNLVTSSTGIKAYNVDMAASMIAALPTLIIYILASKFFVRGLTAGAVKG